MRGDAERQANMLLAVTPDSFIPEEHPIRRIKPIVESAAADRTRLGGAPWDGASVSSGLGSAGASIGHHASEPVLLSSTAAKLGVSRSRSHRAENETVANETVDPFGTVMRRANSATGLLQRRATERGGPVNAPHLVAVVRAGGVFIDGTLQERQASHAVSDGRDAA